MPPRVVYNDVMRATQKALTVALTPDTDLTADKTCAVRMPPAMWEAVQAVAQEETASTGQLVTGSDVVRRALRTELRRKERVLAARQQRSGGAG